MVMEIWFKIWWKFVIIVLLKYYENINADVEYVHMEIFMKKKIEFPYKRNTHTSFENNYDLPS